MAGDNLVVINDDTFKSTVTASKLPVIVDFWAEWCGPCRMVAPIYAELAGDYAGKISFAKLNVTDNPQAAADHGVSGIPTFIVFREGKEVARFVGALGKEQFKEKLDKLLKP